MFSRCLPITMMATVAAATAVRRLPLGAILREE